MITTTIAFGTFVTLFFGSLLLIWLYYFSARWSAASLDSRRVSWYLLLLFMASKTLIFQSRLDPAALINEGLSAQNFAQVACTLFSAIWAAILIGNRRVRFADTVAGPNFWITSLIAVYALSALWSVWPTLTIFRVLELCTFWVLCIHVFSQSDWLDNFENFLWSMILLFWVGGLLNGANTLLEGTFIAGLRDNTGSAVAAVTIVFVIFRSSIDGFRANLLKLFAASISLMVFGSLTSTVALVCALVVFAAYYAFRSDLWMMFFVWNIAGVLLVIHVAILMLGNPSSIMSSSVMNFGAIFDKGPEILESWTGRLPLWLAIWDSAKDTLWGHGYAAAERIFVLSSATFGWDARHSHNGYISAWLGAGWIGAILVFTIFWSIGIRSTSLRYRIRPLILSVLVLIAINNLTTLAVGGNFGSLFALMMALACIPAELSVNCRNVVKLPVADDFDPRLLSK